MFIMFHQVPTKEIIKIVYYSFYLKIIIYNIQMDIISKFIFTLNISHLYLEQHKIYEIELLPLPTQSTNLGHN